MASSKVLQPITPAPGFRRDRVAGVQKSLVMLDSGFRRNDTKEHFLTSYEFIKGRVPKKWLRKILSTRF